MSKKEGDLHVLVATPLGRGGKGGIDRIMDALADELRAHPLPGFDLAFGVTRGQRHIAWSLWHVSATCLRILGARGRKPDLVHVNLASFGSLYRKLVVTLACRLAGVPYLLHLHGAEFDVFWRAARPALARRILSMFEQAAAIVVLGRSWRDFVAAQAPAAAGRIVILPNATPRGPERRAAATAPVRILFLGRVGARKGAPELVEAFARLADRADWTAVVAGDGEVEPTRKRLAERGLAARVSAPGWVGPREVDALLAQADILVLPSHEENLPMSVIEGMAYGLAVVATPVGATPDILENERTGLLVAPGDAAALAEALARLIDDPALRARLGAAAQAFHHERLDIVVYARDLAAIWRRAVRPARAAAAGEIAA